MKLTWIIGLLLISGAASAERVVVGANAKNDRIVVYYWVDQDGQRHFTDDPRKAPKAATKRVVHTPQPAYSAPVVNVSAPVGQQTPPLPPSVAPPTSLPPSGLPPVPPLALPVMALPDISAPSTSAPRKTI